MPAEEQRPTRHPLDLSPEEFRRLGYRAVDLLAEHLAGLTTSPARNPVPEHLKQALLGQPVPESPTDPDTILDDVAARVLPHPMGNGSPRFFGSVNSPAAPIGAIAELLAAGMNPSVAGGDHVATYLEHAVLRWLRAVFGFSADGGALLTSGGSVANLIGLAVMRHVKTGGRVRAGGMAGPALVVYASTQAHSCVEKAVELLGIGHDNLRRVPVDPEWRMDPHALADLVAKDRAAGLAPACVAATAGTVNTGAIDPLADLAAFCRAEGLWLHVDGAYGGPGVLAEELAGEYRGLERADSLAVDPHKWLYVPVECGCALVRDARAMRDAFSLVPPYLRDDSALPWFSEFGIQQSRGFRALKLWMVLRQLGLDGYRRSIERDIALARALRERLRAAADYELLSASPLSITCFRYRPAELVGREAELDQLNRKLLAAVQAEGTVFLTSTELHGRFALRACTINFRTTEADLDTLVQAVRLAGERARRG